MTMKVIRSDKTAWYDVDDTLVKWAGKAQKGDQTICITFGPITEEFVVIRENVESMRRHAARGHVVNVWSAGGYAWAEAVVKALGLEEIVTLVCSKPTWIIDDLEAVEWMPKAQFHVKR